MNTNDVDDDLPDEDGQDEAADLALTSREGWFQFVDTVVDPVRLLATAEWKQLSESARFDYDQARIDHHVRLVTVRTGIVKAVARAGRHLTVLNRHQIGARRGLIVSGLPNTGKSIAVTQLGLAHEHAVRRRYPNSKGRKPVVYVTVPPAATPRMLAVEYAEFLGIPITRNWNQADITNAVCRVLIDSRCELVIIDEIHNLNIHTSAGAEASDQLKYLSERIPATFVYAGIEVETAGLFSGPRGRKIAGRFATIASLPFARTTLAEQREWDGLIATFEAALRLHRHRPGSLTDLSGYLHDRSGGFIGSLSHLVRDTAINAIEDGTERITRTGLDAVLLDHAAQNGIDLRRPRARS